MRPKVAHSSRELPASLFLPCSPPVTSPAPNRRGMGTKRSFLFRRISPLALKARPHMVEFPIPTRSEICHLADTVRGGFKGVVLSNETVYGHYPLRALAVIKDTVRVLTEDSQKKEKDKDRDENGLSASDYPEYSMFYRAKL